MKRWLLLLSFVAPCAWAATRPGIALRTVVFPPSPRVGQQVVVSWFLDSKTDVDSYDLLQEPLLDEAVMPLPVVRSSGDDPVKSFSVRRYAFYPERAGLIRIPPIAVHARVQQDMQAFGSAYAELDATSAAVTIQVTALPAGANPAAVGAMSLDCDSLRTVDGVLGLELTVNGNGSFFDEVRPHFETAPDFRFDLRPLTPVKTGLSGGPVHRSQRWKLTLQSEAAARVVTIPDLVLDYFDPRAGSVQQSRCRGREVDLPKKR